MQKEPEETKNIEAHNKSDLSQQEKVSELNQSREDPDKQEQYDSDQVSPNQKQEQEQGARPAKAERPQRSKAAFKTTDLMLGRVAMPAQPKPRTPPKAYADEQPAEAPALATSSGKDNLETDRNALQTGRAMLTTEAAPGPEEAPDKKELKSKKRKKAKKEGMDVGNAGQLNKDLAICKSEADMKQSQEKQNERKEEIELQEIIKQATLQRMPAKSKSTALTRQKVQREVDLVPVKNPKFNNFRNSILERPSHYNNSMMAAEGGQEINHEEVQMTEQPMNKEQEENQEGNKAEEGAGGEADHDTEKKGYMLKEQEFYKQLKFVQNYYLEICICLMKLGKFFFFVTAIYALVCMFWFGCGVGECQNTLICCVHYIKLIQGLTVYSSYSHNITEKIPTHPVGTINAFITIFIYYILLYVYQDLLIEDANLIHFIAVYLGLDIILICISLFSVRKVKIECQKLIHDVKFKEYSQEAELALQDVLYLPIDAESDEEDADM